jgi:hypothetical protein
MAPRSRRRAARRPGAAQLRGRAADLELRVPVDEPVARDERGEVRLVGDVEEDGADAHHEAEDVQLPDRERVERVREWDRRERERAAEVAEDEDRLPRQPIDPDAGGERDQEERQHLDGTESRDLER